MSEKTFSSRFVCKHDTEENWKKATNFSPKQAELIIYDIDENYSYERFKIGDGTTNVNDLPFVGQPPTVSNQSDSFAVADNTIYYISNLANSITITVPSGGMVFSSIVHVALMDGGAITWSGATHYNGDEPASGEVWEFSILNNSVIGTKLEDA